MRRVLTTAAFGRGERNWPPATRVPRVDVDWDSPPADDDLPSPVAGALGLSRRGSVVGDVRLSYSVSGFKYLLVRPAMPLIIYVMGARLFRICGLAILFGLERAGVSRTGSLLLRWI